MKRKRIMLQRAHQSVKATRLEEGRADTLEFSKLLQEKHGLSLRQESNCYSLGVLSAYCSRGVNVVYVSLNSRTGNRAEDIPGNYHHNLIIFYGTDAKTRRLQAEANRFFKQKGYQLEHLCFGSTTEIFQKRDTSST